LAEGSRRDAAFMQKIEEVVKQKTKAVAWFVSHCQTHSQRERIMAALGEKIHVDIYGACGTLQCQKNSECEKRIGLDYHFYFAGENSICKDYITEKLWNQGYGYLVVPIVLRRWVVERYLPPNSFIAVDDYTDVQQMTKHLNALMRDKTKYMEYFKWRADYEVVILDDYTHPTAERPWGFCQVCRMTQMDPRPQATIENMHTFWDESCEAEGEFANKFLSGLRATPKVVAMPPLPVAPMRVNRSAISRKRLARDRLS